MEADQSPLTLHPKAYRFFPKRQEEKTKHEKSGTRFFFYGQIEHDDYEKKKLKQFHEWIAKNKHEYNKDYFNEQKLLLMLAGNSYKPEKCFTAMKAHLEFRHKYLPSEINPIIQGVLKTGFYYPCGRDLNFRPIMVFNIKLIDFKHSHNFLVSTIHVQEQVIKHMMIPGQVQNWVVIYDLQNMGVTELPMSTIKEVLQVISANYGGRLYKLFVVNAPSTIYFSWKAVSAFLDPVTVDKVSISKTNTDKKLWEICRPSQIEQKYGGKQPNKTEYYPFSIPEADYDESRLISDQQYGELLKQGKLSRNEIDPKFK